MSEFRGLGLQEQDDQIRDFGPTGQALRVLWERLKGGPIADFATTPPSATSRGFDFVFKDWPEYMLSKIGDQDPLEPSQPPLFNPWAPGSAEPDLPWDRDKAGIPFGGGPDIGALLGPRQTEMLRQQEAPVPRTQMPRIPEGISRERYDEFLQEMADLGPTAPEERQFGLQDILGAAAGGTIGAQSAGEALAGAGSAGWAAQRAFEDEEMIRREMHHEAMREHRAALAQAGLMADRELMEDEWLRYEAAQRQAQIRGQEDMLEWQRRQPQFQFDRQGNMILSHVDGDHRVVERIEIPTLLDEIDMAARAMEAQGASLDEILDRTIEIGDRKFNISGNVGPEVTAMFSGAAATALRQIPLREDVDQLFDRVALMQLFPGASNITEAQADFDNLTPGEMEAAHNWMEVYRTQAILDVMQGKTPPYWSDQVTPEFAAQFRSTIAAYMDPQVQRFFR